MLEDARLVLAVLALCVVVGEWLGRRPGLRHAGSSLLVIVLAAVLANLGLIPAGSTPQRPVPAYDAIFAHGAPLAIFWLVLRVDLRRTLAAGLPLLSMFGVGALGTVLGVVTGLLILGPDAFGPSTAALGGMFAATYIGGSANFNALALHYDVVRQGTLYAGTVAVDAGLTALWMVATIAIPRAWRAPGRPTSEPVPAHRPPAELAEAAPPEAALAGVARVDAAEPSPDAAPVDPLDLALVLALGLGALAVTDAIVDGLAGWGLVLPDMVVLTALALALAQLPSVGRLASLELVGMVAVQLFLATIGAFCDLAAVVDLGRLGLGLVGMASAVIGVHGALIFGLTRLLRLDPDVAAVASQANIGGGTTALALARGLARPDLVLPAILVGSLGTALGTFVGFAVAEVAR